MDNLNLYENKNTKYNIKQSPHYDEQKEEVELLQNIIPDRLTTLSDDPNYILEIIVKSSLENPEKEYRLKIYLNYFYPEKSPRFEFYEINDFLQEKIKMEMIQELNKILEENLGMGVLYQLYECALELADKEEERRTKILNEYEKQKLEAKFNISQMKQFKQIDNYYVTDVVILKNNYLVLACSEDKYCPHLTIYDEFYENEIQVINLIKGNEVHKTYQYTIKKLVLYNVSSTKDDLYIVCSDKFIRNYKINYLSKKNKKSGLNINIDYNSFYVLPNTLDMNILNDYNNIFLLVSSKEIIFWNHNDEFKVEDSSIISSVGCKINFGDIFIFNKNLFILIGYKSSIIFLHINDNDLKSFKWGKEINIKCEPNKNYINKVNDKNVVFWNKYLKEIIIIYIPTQEITTKIEKYSVSSICSLNNLTYFCSKDGINEVEFKNEFLELTERNNKYKNITLIKRLNKGYICLGNEKTLYICK